MCLIEPCSAVASNGLAMKGRTYVENGDFSCVALGLPTWLPLAELSLPAVLGPFMDDG